MKTEAPSPVLRTGAKPVELSLSWARIADLIELTKPRVAILVLFTVAAGALLGSKGAVPLSLLLNTVLGTALVAAGASALNQVFERHSDALMRRTENRPLPAGRLGAFEASLFGLFLALGGLAYLGWTVRQPLTVLIVAGTLVGYVFVYTPLKRKTTLNTLVGAVPGALPPVIGWTAATGSLDGGALLLFVILFLWQVPHFLAIAWIYREEYARAGLKMLPVLDREGVQSSRQMIAYCLALLPVSLMPVLVHQAGLLYGAGSLAIGVVFLYSAFEFRWKKDVIQARRVLRASLVYLPVLLGLLLLENLV
ncbi:MAG: protoheme IX farnesyltransferase [Planctomycetes bacterium]|nr:protoheme IX farnesyltransferase [Planctomycetota bacterium]